MLFWENHNKEPAGLLSPNRTKESSAQNECVLPETTLNHRSDHIIMHLSFKLHKNIVFHKSFTHRKSQNAQNHSFPRTRSSPHILNIGSLLPHCSDDIFAILIGGASAFLRLTYAYILVKPPGTTLFVMLLSCHSFGKFCNNM